MDESAQGIGTGYLEGPHWQRLRRVSRFLAQGLCEAPQCQRSEGLDCHHLHYRSKGRESLFDVASLCRDCHDGLTGGGSLDIYLGNRRRNEREERGRALTAEREERRSIYSTLLQSVKKLEG